MRTTITTNKEQQSLDLFGSIRIVARNPQGKSIIKLCDVMYTLESPCNIISNRIFKLKRLYLDRQRDINYNGNQIVANYPILKGVNVRVLQLHLDYKTILQEQGILLVAIKSLGLLFEL